MLELLPRPVRPADLFAPCPIDLGEVTKLSELSLSNIASQSEADSLGSFGRPLVVRQVQVMPPTPDLRVEADRHLPAAPWGLGSVGKDPLDVLVEVLVPAEEFGRGGLHLHDLRHSSGSGSEDICLELRIGAHAVHIRVTAAPYP